MENNIPNTFDNFEQRLLARGLETKSETHYKGYIIVLRCYTMSGISNKIIKTTESGKRIRLREQHWNFYNPLDLLNKTKKYIDEFESNLINKFNNHYKNK